MTQPSPPLPPDYTEARHNGNTHTAARYFAERYRWRVLPTRRGSKLPATPHGVKDATLEPEQVDIWWEEEPTYDVAVACGASGLTVLDYDGRNDIDGEALARLEELLAGVHTLTVHTPSGGKHWYFRAPPGCPIRSTKLFNESPAVDVRASGAYVKAPPSQGANGNHYRWGSGHTLASPPPGILELLTRIIPPGAVARPRVPSAPLRERFERKYGHIGVVIEGQRNQTLFEMASWLRGEGAAVAEIEAVLLGFNQRCSPPLPEREVCSIAAGVASRYSPRFLGWTV